MKQFSDTLTLNRNFKISRVQDRLTVNRAGELGVSYSEFIRQAVWFFLAITENGRGPGLITLNRLELDELAANLGTISVIPRQIKIEKLKGRE